MRRRTPTSPKKTRWSRDFDADHRQCQCVTRATTTIIAAITASSNRQEIGRYRSRPIFRSLPALVVGMPVRRATRFLNRVMPSARFQDQLRVTPRLIGPFFLCLRPMAPPLSRTCEACYHYRPLRVHRAGKSADGFRACRVVGESVTLLLYEHHHWHNQLIFLPVNPGR